MRPIDRGIRPIAFLIGDARRDELKRIRMSHEMSCASINDNSLIFADLIYMDLRLIFQIRLWLLVIIAFVDVSRLVWTGGKKMDVETDFVNFRRSEMWW